MNNRHHLAFLVLAAMLASACASNPSSQPRTAQRRCEALRAQIAAAQDDKDAAVQKKKDAHKARVPVLVAARFAHGQAEMGHADARIGALQSELEQLGCNPL